VSVALLLLFWVLVASVGQFYCHRGFLCCCCCCRFCFLLLSLLLYFCCHPCFFIVIVSPVTFAHSLFTVSLSILLSSWIFGSLLPLPLFLCCCHCCSIFVVIFDIPVSLFSLSALSLFLIPYSLSLFP
jgi:hypothetical protein